MRILFPRSPNRAKGSSFPASKSARIASKAGVLVNRIYLSLSRLNHRLPRGYAHPEVVQGTADFHHQIANTLLPQANSVFDNTTTLDTTVDMFDPQPALMQGLIV